MKEVRVIECVPKMRQPGNWAWKEKWASAKVVCLCITEDEANDHERIGRTWQRMLKEENVNTKFIVIPNGVFLPVPASHYRAV